MHCNSFWILNFSKERNEKESVHNERPMEEKPGKKKKAEAIQESSSPPNVDVAAKDEV